MRISEVENPYQDVNELLAQALAEMREERTQQRRAAAKKGVRRKENRGPYASLRPTRTEFGAWVRMHRVNQRRTLTDVAEQAGIKHGHLSNIESGQRDPSPKVITGIARALGVSDTERDVMLVKEGYMPESMKERVLAMLGGDGHE